MENLIIKCLLEFTSTLMCSSILVSFLKIISNSLDLFHSCGTIWVIFSLCMSFGSIFKGIGLFYVRYQNCGQRIVPGIVSLFF